MNIPAQAIKMANRYFAIENKPNLSDQYTDAYLVRELTARISDIDPRHANDILNGSFRRRISALIQLIATDKGIDAGAIDGFWGPQTQFAFDSLLYLENNGTLPPDWRDDPPADTNPNGWPNENEAALTAFYGQPANESNLVLINVPYEHRISWNLTQRATRIRCHRKVADSLLRVLTNVRDHYGIAKIRELHLDHFAGCYEPRRKRGGTAWSTHAWGIALDYDHNRNKLEWGRDRAAFAQPEYLAWWQIWEAEGWVSLGRSANFDWMHVQAARR
jgi:hypothetical protein